MPCSEKRARLLLDRGRAKVHRVTPFVIRLVDRKQKASELQPLRVKLDPGSKCTGMALVRDKEEPAPLPKTEGLKQVVLNLFEIEHRGQRISETLSQRRALRRSRRTRKLRYRAPRFLNRGNKGAGWLAPSLEHRVLSILSWVNRLKRWSPVQAISLELVRFDTHAIQNPEISGVEYQQGELAGYELREYLLQKWGRKCAYCGKEHVPLNLDHIVPKSKGGSNRASNMTLACVPCNQKKGNRDIREFVTDKSRLARILAHAKAPLKDAAAVNATRWRLYQTLQATGLPVEVGTGGRTKWNRARLEIPKTHALDAVCVGKVADTIKWQGKPCLMIKATGRGRYKRTHLTAHGFPRAYLMRQKFVFGFQSGDLVRAIVPKGKNAGSHVGRVAIRATGTFDIKTNQNTISSSYKYFHLIQRSDGYGYTSTKTPN